MENLVYILSAFPNEIREILTQIDALALNSITEIRIRKNKPLIVYIGKSALFISVFGKLMNHISNSVLCINECDFEYILDRLCNNSYHTKMQTMVDGYITSNNGIRIGIASSAVYNDNEIKSVKNITSINIRIAKEHKDCSRKILNMLYINETPSVIVAGGVGSGKTTFLRDYSRLLSSGFANEYKKIAVIDERNEIAAQFDIGINTDVLTNFNKAKGIEIAVRTLSPDIIVCDEIGSDDELDSIKFGFKSGVAFAVSVHAKSKSDLFDRTIINQLVQTKEFKYIILLNNYTENFEIIKISEENFENSRNDFNNSFFFLP